jgi:DNA replication protein DnaC
MYKLKIDKKVIDLLKQGWFLNKNGIKKTGFLFWSEGPGTGKTLLALSVMNSLAVEHGLTARFENTTIMFHDLRKYFNMDRDNLYYNELEYLDKLADVNVLILDDIGTEKISEWVREKLYFIMESRNVGISKGGIKEGKINLFTSNHSPDALAERIGDKIVSRIMEYNEPIEFIGEDWRNKQK